MDQSTDNKLIPIHIMGKRYEVPDGLTIMRAMEHAGYRLVRGVGCRGGFCGACATTYRVEGQPRLHMALACQDLAVPNMHLTQLPYFPAHKAIYQLEEIGDPALEAIRLYPELATCMGCNTCNKSCPQGLQVMEYVAAMLRGDLAEAAELSFDCVMCGLCTARCPAGITQYQAAMYARRAYSCFAGVRPGHLDARLQELSQGKWAGEVEGLTKLDASALKQLYVSRDMETPTGGFAKAVGK
ncbi:MAG TPA: 4Fe-4S dicluster domain-containing protein [Candidatus Methylomirabilis sp.]|nr:4Fe-4S dicluster domain-containing protein [Candidatus Methylomirabilis sp.]